MDKNLQKYLAFLKTVEYGSFTRAAEMLNYSQSGISRMIADLEKEWQLTLLQRGRTGIKLTAEGSRLLPYAQGVCQAYTNMQMQVDDLHGLQAGIIRIGTVSSVATHWLPNIIRAFQQDYPGIDYELLLGDYTEIEDWIAQGRVDCGFLRLPTRAEFDTVPLDSGKLLAILPMGHPLCACEKVPLAALCKEPFLLLEKGAKTEISEVFERNGLQPRVHFTTWDDYAIMALVESGLGVSMVPDLILQRIPYRIVAKEVDVPAYRQIALALRDANTASLAVKEFLEYLPYRNSTAPHPAQPATDAPH